MTYAVAFLFLFIMPDVCHAAPALIAMGMSAGTAATVATVATYASTAISVMGALKTASDSANASEYNAVLANQNAAASRQQAAANAAAQSRASRQQIGRMEAGYGASGVVGSEGSPMEILQQSAREAELDYQNILYGGETRAGGYENTAVLEEYRADSAQTSGYLSAGRELMGGFGRAQSLTRV